jgi:hypothetical protein
MIRGIMPIIGGAAPVEATDPEVWSVADKMGVELMPPPTVGLRTRGVLPVEVIAFVFAIAAATGVTMGGVDQRKGRSAQYCSVARIRVGSD